MLFLETSLSNRWSNIVTMQRIILIWILLFVGFLSGCSFTSILYDNAPWFLREKVDDYFSITSAQERQLDRDIEMIFKWHRYQELPEYANLISMFNQQFSDGLTREELILFFDRVAAARIRLAEVSLHSASQFLVSINSRQLDRFDSEFQQQLAEDREKTRLPIEQQNQENFSKLLDNLEDWFGNFDEKQQQVLRLVSAARPENNTHWLERREQRHRELLQFLRSKPDASKIKVYLHSRYVQGSDQGPDEVQKEGKEFWLSAMLRIDRLITPAQRKRAMGRLDDYRRDFAYMSQRGPDQLRVKVER